MNCSVFNVRDFETASDTPGKATASIQAAIDACSNSGGGIVYIPAGCYVIGTIHLRSHITLYLAAGAVLLGSPDRQDYPIVADNYFYGTYRAHYSALLSGQGLESVSISGAGIIDGQGWNWWPEKKWKSLWDKYVRDGVTTAPPGQEAEFEAARRAGLTKRPNLIEFKECRGIRLEGVTLRNSPSWTVHPYLCDDVTISGLTIQNPHNAPNTDGINPESCRNVFISNCKIDVGDDCITLKAGTEDAPEGPPRACENITIVNCTMLHGHGGVVIGSEMSGGVRNVTITNCVMQGTDRGVRLKTRRGRGGVVENIRIQNIVMDDVFCPLVVNMCYMADPYAAAEEVTAGTPVFRGISINGITARNARTAGFLMGLPEMPLQDISVNDADIESVSDKSGQAAMLRITTPGAMARPEPFGFVCRHVNGLFLSNMRLRTRSGACITIGSCTNVEIGACRGASGTSEGLLEISDVRNAALWGSVSEQGPLMTGPGSQDAVYSWGNRVLAGK